MFKLTFTLAVALYASFVIWGRPSDVVVEEDATAEVPVKLANVAADYDRPVILSNASSAEPQVTRAAVTETVVPDAAAIAASAPAPGDAARPGRIGEPLVVSLLPDSPPEEETPTAALAEEVETDGLLRVTGTRVNMRAGPSTANRVVDSLPAGTLAEPIGEEFDGWLEIRDVATGQTGFMSSRFLEPA